MLFSTLDRIKIGLLLCIPMACVAEVAATETNFLLEWGWAFGIVAMILDHLVAKSVLKSNSLIDLVVQGLKWLAGKNKE